MGAEDLRQLNFNAKDVLVGIAASGRTPYVIGALEYARSLGAVTGAISCNPDSPHCATSRYCHYADCGAGSGNWLITYESRHGTKLVLNMITTGAMIKMGKVFGNLMVDVEATNAKLIERQIRIVMQATECERATC